MGAAEVGDRMLLTKTLALGGHGDTATGAGAGTTFNQNCMRRWVDPDASHVISIVRRHRGTI